MAGKKKGKGKGKRERKLVDEFQLRRDLREQRRLMDSSYTEQASITPGKEMSRNAVDMRIGGIEGGGTHSTLVIMDGKGSKLIEMKGPDTNHWILGMEETISRLNAMIEKGKESLDIPKTEPLDCVGLSLSGCEEGTTNQRIIDMLKEKYPFAANDYVVSSDSLGSIRTGLENGGIVLIAGTGSNGLLINPDGKTHGCGGWGYMIGDEGSAYWIAYRACKYVFDDIDGLMPSPEPISYVWPAMRNYFNVNDRNAMLLHFYSNFDKSKIASFAKEIAIGCEKEDPLCFYLFREAGQYMAKHVIALSKKAHNDLKLAHRGLKVICVGSVWKSWKYMKDGFVKELHNSKIVDEVSLLHLTASSALGACYLAAEKIDCVFTKPYDDNTELFYHYKRDHQPNNVVDSVDSNVYMVPCNKTSAKD